MKAVVLERTCKPEELEVIEVPLPVVKPGWVLVKVLGFGINRSEVILREYEADEDYINLPVIPGIECVGRIVDASDSDYDEDDLVVSLMGGMGRSFDGSYAEYALLPTKNVFKVSSKVENSLSLEELIAIPETFFTSYGSLYDCLNLQENDTLLIRGATSAAGMNAIKLAKATGTTVLATSRNEKKFNVLTRAGADYAILDDGEIYDKVLTLYPEGVDKVLEFVGPATMKDSMKALARHGIICVTGVLGKQEYIDGFDPIKDVPNGKYLTSFFSNYPTQEIMDNLFNFIVDNHIKPEIFKVYNSLSNVKDAHMLMESNKGHGKIIFKLE